MNLDKKGSSILLMVFEIMVVLFVIWTIFSIAESYGSSQTTQKITIANDLSTMINTLVATPGDVIIQYPKDTSTFTVVLTASSVTVFSQEDSSIKRIKRFYSLPRGFSAVGTVEKVSEVCLRKDGQTIYLEKC